MVKVYLPRSVGVQACEEVMTLGQLAIVRCDDEPRLQAASAVALGRLPQSKEKMVISRSTVAARLATAGFRGSAVQFTGAAEMTVHRDEKALPAEEIVEAARTFLQESQAAPRQAHLELADKVDDLLVPSASRVELRVRALPESSPSQVRVRVAAMDGERELGARELTYKRVYAARQAVLTQDVSGGTVLTDSNVEVRSVMSDRPQEADWKPPLGQVVACSLRAGTVLADGHVRTAQAQTLVKKNQAVTMRIQAATFTLSAAATALQDGRGGDLIKVRNNDTQRVVTARVTADGTVEPVVE